jgi:DNA-binding PadR family transcriptional regulator
LTAHETRLLLLGAVALFEPVNGYQIRRELVSWQVDRWAHVNPGSIYHGLTTLSRAGHLQRHDLRDAGRDVAVYELTDAGRVELDRLLRTSLETVDFYDRVAFHAAFSMLPLLDTDTVLACLETRRAGLERVLAEYSPAAAETGELGPPHAVRSLELYRESAETELGWLRRTLLDIREGRLRFEQGEDWGWTPPADDPGWQMNLDREKYRALLGR